MLKKDKIKNIGVWPNKYFKYRQMNDPLRIAQYKIDAIFINKFIKKLDKVNLCDVGCGTGEFLRCLKLDANLYGMETNLVAKKKGIEFYLF
jgi:ubiquinone/menaquinone biosynthesis C-methylase UbiE